MDKLLGSNSCWAKNIASCGPFNIITMAFCLENNDCLFSPMHFIIERTLLCFIFIIASRVKQYCIERYLFLVVFSVKYSFARIIALGNTTADNDVGCAFQWCCVATTVYKHGTNLNWVNVRRHVVKMHIRHTYIIMASNMVVVHCKCRWKTLQHKHHFYFSINNVEHEMSFFVQNPDRMIALCPSHTVPHPISPSPM